MDFCNEIINDDKLLAEISRRQHETENELFAEYNGIRITKLGAGGAEGEMLVTKHSLNPHGIVHGGALAALADTMGGTAAFAAYGKGGVTVNYSMSFLRPAKGSNEKIFCRALPVKLGRQLCVYSMFLTDDAGVEVATGNFTFYMTGWFKSQE